VRIIAGIAIIAIAKCKKVKIDNFSNQAVLRAALTSHAITAKSSGSFGKENSPGTHRGRT
jgi:hypothetical protein